MRFLFRLTLQSADPRDLVFEEAVGVWVDYRGTAGGVTMRSEKGGRKKSIRPDAPKIPALPRAKAVSFQLSAPEAKTVTVAGEFNKWDMDANPLRRDRQGVWKTTLRLQPGTYQYKFVIDGEEWRADPLNPHTTPDSHGAFNSVRDVG